jgi:hypothetical protein
MWPRYIPVSFNFAGTGWIFQYIFLQSCMCLRIPILWHLVVTTETHFYLQNSNSTFFLIDNIRRPDLSHIPFWRQHNLSRRHITFLPLAFLVTDKRRAQTGNSIVLRNLHILAKLKARRIIIQRTEMLWYCVMPFLPISHETEVLHKRMRGEGQQFHFIV